LIDTTLLPEVNLADALERYDLLSVQGEYVVMAPRQLATPESGMIGEIGGTSTTTWGRFATAEYNPKLAGESGIKVYNEMRRQDAMVRMSLRLYKTPVLAARWYIDPASSRKKDIRVADFVWKCLTQYPSSSWWHTLNELLAFVDFGWYALEKVYKMQTIEDKQYAVWQKLAPRHPADKRDFKYDKNGGPDGIIFNAPGENAAYDEVFIPIEKMLVFTLDQEAGDLEGTPLLRSAYKHWYFKDNLYKIDAIQKERHGIGIPCIVLPLNFNDADRAKADEIGRNLRTNERAHVVLPPNWEIKMLKMEGQPVNALESIEHHNRQIAMNVMAPFMQDGNVTDTGYQLFLQSCRYVASIVREVFNKWAIPQLVDYNFNVDEYPELKFMRIGDTVDWRTLSFAIRNLIGAKVVQPDDALETWIRDEMDLPKVDTATIRQSATPQAPGQAPMQPTQAPVGPPRQSTAAGSQQGKRPENQQKAGQDRSGG
jgi:hypothetical protein